MGQEADLLFHSVHCLSGLPLFSMGNLSFGPLSPFEMAYLAMAVSKSGACLINQKWQLFLKRGLNLLRHGPESSIYFTEGA